jgi:hypothetical protein
MVFDGFESTGCSGGLGEENKVRPEKRGWIEGGKVGRWEKGTFSERV